MVKYLIFLAAMSLFLPLACGCSHAKALPTAKITSESPSDLYMCGYMTDADKAAQELKCASQEVYLEYFIPLIKDKICGGPGNTL